MKFPSLTTLLLCALLASGHAHAGRSCEETKPTVQSITRGLSLAERTMQALEAEHTRSGARVGLLARAGQDLRKYGLQFSHLGFVYRTPEGQWRVLHKLNHCGTAESAIYRQGLGEFFLDTPWRYEAAWTFPSPEVQERLVALLADPPRSLSLHHKPYSIVSYAWGKRYQQSNQWALETLAAAMEPGITNRDAAQAWLMFKGYQPTTLNIGALTRLGGRMSQANVAFDDHPNEQRFSDRIATVTVDSMFSWLTRTSMAPAPQRIELAP